MVLVRQPFYNRKECANLPENPEGLEQKTGSCIQMRKKRKKLIHCFAALYYTKYICEFPYLFSRNRLFSEIFRRIFLLDRFLRRKTIF